MFSRQESILLKQEFWTTFGKWSALKRRRLTGRSHWLLNKSGVSGIRFRFSAENKQIGVCCELITKNENRKQELLHKFSFIKSQYTEYEEQKLIWDLENNHFNPVLISIRENGLTPMNKEHWPKIFTFFFDNMTLLEKIFDEHKDFLEG